MNKYRPFFADCWLSNADEIYTINLHFFINKTKFNLGIVQKKLGEMWSEITDEEKQKYDSLCEEDKERYTTEYEAY